MRRKSLGSPTSAARAAAVLAALVLAAGGALSAQPGGSGGPYEPVRRDPLGTRLIDLATPFTAGARTVELLFTHRFVETVSDGSAHDLWGLDGGAEVGLGVTVGLTDHLDLALYRSSFQEDYELAAKLALLEQAPRVPLSLSLRAGADLVGREGIDHRDRPFVQVLLMRRLAPGIDLLAAPSWVRHTPTLENAVNLPLGLTFGLPGGALLEAEVVPKNRDLSSGHTAWMVALSKAVGAHLFELTVGNSRATTVDQMLGGDFAGGFDDGDVRLGFNLVRTFHHGPRGSRGTP